VSYEVNKPELRIGIDRSRAAALGVTIEDISSTLQILFGGLDLSRIKVDGKEYQVMAQLERASRLTPRDLDRVFVRNGRGELIQLSSLVTRSAGCGTQFNQPLRTSSFGEHHGVSGRGAHRHGGKTGGAVARQELPRRIPRMLGRAMRATCPMHRMNSGG
jgi:hypothetical protein